MTGLLFDDPSAFPEPLRLRLATIIRRAYWAAEVDPPFSVRWALQGKFCAECGRQHLTDGCS